MENTISMIEKNGHELEMDVFGNICLDGMELGAIGAGLGQDCGFSEWFANEAKEIEAKMGIGAELLRANLWGLEMGDGNGAFDQFFSSKKEAMAAWDALNERNKARYLDNSFIISHDDNGHELKTTAISEILG